MSRLDDASWRVVRRIAYRYGHDTASRDDCTSVGIIAVLEAEPGYRDEIDWLLFVYRVAFAAIWAYVRREQRRDHGELSPHLAVQDSPEPDDLTVELLGCLTHNEARVIQLHCGLGGEPRSFGDVAWMERRLKRPVYYSYLKAVRKLRARLDALQRLAS